MQNFIVLGIIPGTNIQVTFSFWLYVATALVGLLIAVKLWRKRYTFIAFLIGFYIARQINRRQLLA